VKRVFVFFFAWLVSLGTRKTHVNAVESLPAPDPSLDYRSPQSNNRKVELMGREWGTILCREYLWYDLGKDCRKIDGEEREKLIKTAFASDFNIDFGAVEIHRSCTLPGEPYVLRLRGKLNLLPSLTIYGRECPLYQYGYGDGSEINFFRRFKHVQSRPSQIPNTETCPYRASGVTITA
jgi:hypothetical protein